MSSNPTYPHDYRVFCASAAQPVVVGGQAVNLWAITFLTDSSPVSARSEFSSVDLDVLANPSVLAFLEKLPAWTFTKTPIWAFGGTFCRSVESDKFISIGAKITVGCSG